MVVVRGRGGGGGMILDFKSFWLGCGYGKGKCYNWWFFCVFFFLLNRVRVSVMRICLCGVIGSMKK